MGIHGYVCVPVGTYGYLHAHFCVCVTGFVLWGGFVRSEAHGASLDAKEKEAKKSSKKNKKNRVCFHATQDLFYHFLLTFLPLLP